MMRHPRAALARATIVVAMAGLAASGATAATAVSALAGAIPDSVQMSELRLAAAKAPVLLVRGDFGLRELRKPLLDSTGVRSANWESAAHARPAIVSTADAPHATPPPRITWNEISSIETQHQQKTKWTLMGGITGLAVGMLIFGLSDDTAETGELPPGAGWLFGLPVVCATTGFIVGSMTGTRTIYPQSPQENP
jgi:hypothetical protein